MSTVITETIFLNMFKVNIQNVEVYNCTYESGGGIFTLVGHNATVDNLTMRDIGYYYSILQTEDIRKIMPNKDFAQHLVPAVRTRML